MFVFVIVAKITIFINMESNQCFFLKTLHLIENLYDVLEDPHDSSGLYLMKVEQFVSYCFATKESSGAYLDRNGIVRECSCASTGFFPT